MMENLITLSACLGLVAHLIFIHGEWHMQAPQLALAYILSPLPVFVLTLWRDSSLLSALLETVGILLSFSATLFGSIVVYRLVFHPLRSFPGPLGARVSKLWQVSKLQDARNHLLIHELHRKYGPIVRTGPNELTICDPAVMPAINGSNTCIKAPVYDLSYPLKGINLSRNFAEHHGRRKIWDPAFTSKALDDYAERIYVYGEQLDSQLAQRTGQKLLANDWFEWFSFDVIGDLALSRDFGMLRDAEWHHSIKVMREGMGMFGMLTPVPWFCRIGASLPGSQDEGLPKLLEWIRQRMNERLEAGIGGGGRRDIASYLIEGAREAEGGGGGGDGKIDMNWLYGDGFAIITAGSETVGLTLVFAFYELARSPIYQTKIYDELRQFLPSLSRSTANKAVRDHRALQQCQYLTGFINEVMRVHPAVPTSGYRIVGPAGLELCGRHIPAGATVSGPRYSLGRMESCFARPEEIIPERWSSSSSKSDLVRDRRAFSPFSIGSMNCIGQRLAMLEMRYVIALLVARYVVAFAEGEDGSRVEGDMKDCFSAVPGDLELVFKER